MNSYHYLGKVALITGASSGIGEVYAKELAARGCHVILTARSKDKLEALASEITRTHGVQAYALPIDLSKAEAPRLLAKSISELGVTVDILINNAGFGTTGRFEDINPEREQEQIMLNTAALVELTHLFLPGMLGRKDGVVVNVASMAAFAPCAYLAVYGATKAFVLSFSEALWAETRERGVRVLALCPGATDTGFFDAVGSRDMVENNTLSTPEKVVQAGFRGVDRNSGYIIDGRINYMTTLICRILPRRSLALINERNSRPKAQ
ncbi:SDR family NAD(P)-dependent oxidoreductase [Paenibacillus riograndensis]|uniref:Short-chain dehydrogenase n=1 Tax=Paenibacillus riograndensis SBR5 TaxID=1073571 RepID=A0A0E4CZZ0_9BACL|nr:SDR family oxidoreductase [Paenibacillus riograndensis]CQR59111.1 short-chain dehydrogenase [Paenibacillus riograndensis SBR5]